MAAVPGESGRSATPNQTASLRGIRLLRAVVLALAGLAITFTATLHENLGFDQSVVAASLGLIGAVQVVAWTVMRAPRPATLLISALVSIAAGAAVLFPRTVIGFALVVAAWALVAGLLEFIGAALHPSRRGDATLMGSTAILLALLVLLVREDQVAVLGFFGAYAIVGAVFLAISAFDTRPDETQGEGARVEDDVPTAPTESRA